MVVVVSGMGWICNGGCYGFLDLGLDAMVWLGFKFVVLMGLVFISIFNFFI